MADRPAIFLDRDGVLIHEVCYLSDLREIRMYEDVPSGLKRLKRSGYKLIVITNQSGVARGYFRESFVHRSFEKINRILAQDCVQLDAMYYCPHHPDGRRPYKIRCDCRKPEPGMIRAARREHNIDLARSYMLGDKICDIELALNANVKGILLETGFGSQQSARVGSRFPKTPIFPNFSQAVNFILKETQPLDGANGKGS